MKNRGIRGDNDNPFLIPPDDNFLLSYTITSPYGEAVILCTFPYVVGTNPPYVTASMNGSYSIKYVLPALVPEMTESYSKLDALAMVWVLEKLRETLPELKYQNYPNTNLCYNYTT